MVELATAEASQLWVSRIDAARPGPHYSVDTIKLLRAQLAADVEHILFNGYGQPT